MVCGAVAVVFFPIVFGPLGLILAAVALIQAEQRSVVALAVVLAGSLLGVLFGMLLGAALWGSGVPGF